MDQAGQAGSSGLLRAACSSRPTLLALRVENYSSSIVAGCLSNQAKLTYNRLLVEVAEHPHGTFQLRSTSP